MLKNYTKVKVDESGNKYYLNDEEQFHRLDGPAFEKSSGSKYWRINGKPHRNIDPSVEFSNEKYWWFKGKNHRIGDSVCFRNEYWYIHDKGYTKKEYFNIVWDI